MLTSANRFSRASHRLLDSPSNFAWFTLCSVFFVYGHVFENLSNAPSTLFMCFPSFSRPISSKQSQLYKRYSYVYALASAISFNYINLT